VGVEGFKSYHELISNTFIEMGDGLRLLCKECHDKKSKKENEDRRIFKKLNNPEWK
jgi:hypothetical protein